MRSSSWLLFIVIGCGGKIVETAPIPEENPQTAQLVAPGTPPTEPAPTRPAPAQPAPATVTSLDACEILCERDARCDTTLPALPARDGESGDCRARCEERLAGKCGIDEWLLCYASTIAPSACTPLPEECKPAFCAWAQCAKQPVSNCR